jgi:hypothetical protein
MKARLLLAAGVVAMAGLVGAGGASAVVSVDLGTSTTSTRAAAGKDSSNGADNGIHDTRKVVYYDCDAEQETATRPAGDHLTYNGPKDIWPPNHKYRHLTISATDSDGQGTVMLEVTGSSDETVDGEELNGSGNTTNDYVGPDGVSPVAVASGNGTASTPYKVRGERSGRGDGRTYSFLTVAEFDDMSMCSHTFTATVPHDQRNHTNSGPKNGSTTTASRKRAARLGWQAR